MSDLSFEQVGFTVCMFGWSMVTSGIGIANFVHQPSPIRELGFLYMIGCLFALGLCMIIAFDQDQFAWKIFRKGLMLYVLIVWIFVVGTSIAMIKDSSLVSEMNGPLLIIQFCFGFISTVMICLCPSDRNSKISDRSGTLSEPKIPSNSAFIDKNDEKVMETVAPIHSSLNEIVESK